MQSATTRSLRVLIVDDSQSDTELAAAQLGTTCPLGRNMAVDRAADGVEALAKLNAGQFTLLILDWQMPRMGGAEVLRHVRNSGKRTAVVVLSGLDREEIKENLEALAAVYLNKNQMDRAKFHEAIALAQRLLS